MQIVQSPEEKALEIVSRWFEGRKSNKTRIWYRYFCKYFPGRTDEEISKFLVLCWNDPESAANIYDRFILDNRSKYSPNTLITHYAIMKSLLNYGRVKNFDWVQIKQDMPRRRKSKDVPPTLDQLRKIFDALDIRGKFVLLLMVSSGIRVGAFDYFTLKDLKIVEYEGEKIGIVTVYRGEVEEYFTFCSPECIKYFEMYLEQRRNAGEQLNDNSPLLRTVFNQNSPDSLKVSPASSTSVKSYFFWKLKKVGFQERNFKQDHGYRKFFKTQLEETEMKTNYIEMLRGYVINEREEAYNRPTLDKLLAIYARFKDVLYISEVPKLKETIKQKDERIKSSERDLTAALIIAEKKSETLEARLSRLESLLSKTPEEEEAEKKLAGE